MKRGYRIAMIVAAILLIVGLLVGGAAFAAMQFDITRLNTAKSVTNTHTVDEPFTNLHVDSDTFDLRLIPATDGVCKVVCHETDKITHTLTVENGTLNICKTDTRKWFDFIGIFWADLSIEVYLPETKLDALRVSLNTGDVELPAEFTINTVEIDTDTGDIRCSAMVQNNLTVETDTGSMCISGSKSARIDLSTDTGEIELANVECGNLSAESSTGDVELQSVVASGHVQIGTDTGDVELTDSDAASLFIETATGDVSGTLLSAKVFFTETDTGDVDVPKSATGSRCEIKTDTGDIQMSVK